VNLKKTSAAGPAKTKRNNSFDLTNTKPVSLLTLFTLLGHKLLVNIKYECVKEKRRRN
jgi:hypothetical protein